MGGAWVYEGLNYASIESVMRMSGVPTERWSDVFESVQILESEALEILNG